MNDTPAPRWRRRKDARPGDICAAALEVFAAKGFAAARTEEIAGRAGLSKGTLYRYFPTKAALFQAVVRDAIVPNLAALEGDAAASPTPFPERVRSLLPRFAAIVSTLPLGAVLKMVIGESRNFPDLARIWHEEVVQRAVGLLARLIAEAQARGEIRPGDPRTHAFSLIGPMLLGVLWRETFVPVGAAPIDLVAVARQHADTVLDGLALPASGR